MFPAHIDRNFPVCSKVVEALGEIAEEEKF